MTNLGFNTLECGEYVKAVQKLRPDVVIAMGDVLYGHQPGVKRAEKMGDRTQSWLNALVNGMKDAELGNFNTAVFAPILPIDAEKQSWYLSALQEDFHNDISGLVFYEIESAFEVPRSLRSLPRMWLGAVTGPLQILNQVAAGIDLFTVPFLNDVTDAGIALDFAFGPKEDTGQHKLAPLGLDLWSNTFAVDVSPLRKDCTCYTCLNHHRAYVHHLLDAKEMLAWVLLQLHNCAIMDAFFAAVRRGVSQGTFEGDTAGFEAYYERQLPMKTGQGPRYGSLCGCGHAVPLRASTDWTAARGAINLDRKGKGSRKRIRRRTVPLMTAKHEWPRLCGRMRRWRQQTWSRWGLQPCSTNMKETKGGRVIDQKIMTMACQDALGGYWPSMLLGNGVLPRTLTDFVITREMNVYDNPNNLNKYDHLHGLNKYGNRVADSLSLFGFLPFLISHFVCPNHSILNTQKKIGPCLALP